MGAWVQGKGRKVSRKRGKREGRGEFGRRREKKS
jgi:hypothetical protein